MNEQKRSIWEREIINVSLNRNKKKEWNKDIREEKVKKKMTEDVMIKIQQEIKGK